ncbi:DUF4199 domain-containing protein [Persicitalea jodogahamensis]|uniref:DUF4199 domain-containing protein n=1 Tax=Persicitalea jodogahamensis TaxID=402147 RepID=A0A8J3GB20_9BACT|nr:DUF4199 domain-containing protein [Persicitalea jodogahamensis]GHB73995.1 hypothetical protein GCM10007390_30310 [Persicitalea jodogahamensis]
MQEQPSVARVALKFGVIIGIAVIVYSTILTIAELNQNQGLSSISFLILAAGMVFAMREFRTQNDGFMSYGQGLGIGSLMSTIVGLLSSTFSIFYTQFIDPNVMERAMDKAREDMESRGMSDAQIDAGIEMAQKFQTPGIMFLMGIVIFLVVGFIIALIVSAIMRRNKPVFE